MPSITLPATRHEGGGAFSVITFCQAHQISVAGFYNLKARGLAPAVFKAGKRTLISFESARAWREKMTAETPQDPAHSKASDEHQA